MPEVLPVTRQIFPCKLVSVILANSSLQNQLSHPNRDVLRARHAYTTKQWKPYSHTECMAAHLSPIFLFICHLDKFCHLVYDRRDDKICQDVRTQICQAVLNCCATSLPLFLSRFHAILM